MDRHREGIAGGRACLSNLKRNVTAGRAFGRKSKHDLIGAIRRTVPHRVHGSALKTNPNLRARRAHPRSRKNHGLAGLGGTAQAVFGTGATGGQVVQAARAPTLQVAAENAETGRNHLHGVRRAGRAFDHHRQRDIAQRRARGQPPFDAPRRDLEQRDADLGASRGHRHRSGPRTVPQADSNDIEERAAGDGTAGEHGRLAAGGVDHAAGTDRRGLRPQWGRRQKNHRAGAHRYSMVTWPGLAASPSTVT